MNLGTVFEAVLGAGARRSDLEWELADAESARLAVSTALQRRAPLCPGYPLPGRTGLRPVAGILTLWPDELVARVGAGTTVAELEEALMGHGLALGLDVPDPQRRTLGGCYACGMSGFAGARGISLRNRTVGLSFVDGNARLLAAGARVVKNVAGYDFGGLHYGARGSLGLILDLTVRLLARPQRSVAVWWACRHDELPRRLPEIRSSWGHDAAAEVLVDRVAAVRYGLPRARALEAVTSVPAEILGVSDRVGSLKAGLDADIVVWNLNPLSVFSQPESVYVGGKLLHDGKIKKKKSRRKGPPMEDAPTRRKTRL